MKTMIKRKGLIAGIIIGFALGIYVGPMMALSGSGNENDEWQEKFFGPLLEVMHLVQNSYVEEVSPDELLEGAYHGIMNELDDYSSYIPEGRLEQFEEDTHGEFGGLGIQITFDPFEEILRVEEPIPGTPAFDKGVLAGDIITEIYDYETEQRYETRKFESVHDAVEVLRGDAGTDVRITVIQEDTGNEEEITITREIIELPGVQGVGMIDDDEWNIGYIYAPSFHERTVEDLREAVKKLQGEDMEGLILDFRFNPGGLLSSAIEISDMFLEEATVVSVKGRKMPEEVFETETDDVLTDAPLVVLVNSHSASASEIFAGAIKDNERGLIVGEPTFGKGSVQSVIPLRQHTGALMLTTAAYYTPDGTHIEDEGVGPHIEVVLEDEENRKLGRHLSRMDNRSKEDNEKEKDDADRGASDPDEDTTEEEAFEDIQLQRAIDAIKTLLITGAGSE